jgi:hypothetical protein
MGWIDVAIPGVIGVWLTAWPQCFYRAKEDAPKEAAMHRKLRVMGMVLVGVAVGYFFLKLGSARS